MSATSQLLSGPAPRKRRSGQLDRHSGQLDRRSGQLDGRSINLTAKIRALPRNVPVTVTTPLPNFDEEFKRPFVLNKTALLLAGVLGPLLIALVVWWVLATIKLHELPPAAPVDEVPAESI